MTPDLEALAARCEAAPLGQLLREKREREGLSLRAAGAASGIAFSTLGRIENGGEPSVYVDRVARAWLNGEGSLLPTPPMTLRDWFAGQALPAIIQITSAGQHNPRRAEGELLIEAIGKDAYAMADAMLVARATQTQGNG